jgi:hypothetical protein
MLPLVGGALLHGLCIRYGWFAFLARPIDGGATFRGKPVFGRSKTFRGPIAVALGAWATFVLQQELLHEWAAGRGLELVDYAALPGAWLALLAGFAAELAELPNSFVKRRLGVPPSGTTTGPLAVLFYVWDQLDLLLGYWLVLGPVVGATALRVGVSLAIALAVHPLLTLIGYALRMRATAR